MSGDSALPQRLHQLLEIILACTAILYDLWQFFGPSGEDEREESSKRADSSCAQTNHDDDDVGPEDSLSDTNSDTPAAVVKVQSCAASHTALEAFAAALGMDDVLAGPVDSSAPPPGITETTPDSSSDMERSSPVPWLERVGTLDRAVTGLVVVLELCGTWTDWRRNAAGATTALDAALWHSRSVHEFGQVLDALFGLVIQFTTQVAGPLVHHSTSRSGSFRLPVHAVMQLRRPETSQKLARVLYTIHRRLGQTLWKETSLFQSKYGLTRAGTSLEDLSHRAPSSPVFNSCNGGIASPLPRHVAGT